MPNELKQATKGFINIQNSNNKCFMWCHVRHLNVDGGKLHRITKKDREVVKKVNYEGADFPVSKKDYGEIEILNKICVNVFCYENKVVYPVYLSNQNFNDFVDLLLIPSNFVSHYVYIKDFNKLMFNKTKHKGRKYFWKSCLLCFSSENVLNEHKKDCLLINKEINVKLEKGFIEFKNFNRQIPVPFKIYADFECLLKSLDCGFDNDCFSYTKKNQDHVPCSFAYKVFCIDNKFSKLISLGDNKGRDHCHISAKYRGVAHWSCNINLRITKKVPVIFHNLKGYDIQLIFKALSKFNCKISVIPNDLEKYTNFSLNNLVFVDSMLFMNSSLDKLVKKFEQ